MRECSPGTAAARVVRQSVSYESDQEVSIKRRSIPDSLTEESCISSSFNSSALRASSPMSGTRATSSSGCDAFPGRDISPLASQRRRGKRKKLPKPPPRQHLSQGMQSGQPIGLVSGTVSFGNELLDGRKKRAEFAVLEESTTAEEVCKLLLERWQLPAPQVVLSVTGTSATLSRMESRLERLVLQGLARAVRVVSAWIFTAGTDDGVSGLLGKPVLGKPILGPDTQLIGIAPLKYITHKEAFLSERDRSNEQLKSSLRSSGTAAGDSATEAARHLKHVQYVKRLRNSEDHHALDPNHTHILLHDSAMCVHRCSTTRTPRCNATPDAQPT